MKRSNYRMSAPASHVAFANLIRGLLEGPHTTAELADSSGITANTVRKLMRVFKRHGVVHVAEWSDIKSPAYSVGLDCRDAPKPKPVSRNLVASQYRERRRQAKLLNMLRAQPSEGARHGAD